MSMEYYLEDTEKKIYYFLGKGRWGCLDNFPSEAAANNYIEKIINAFSTVENLKLFLKNEVYSYSKGMDALKDKKAEVLYGLFGGSKSLEIWSDDWHEPPKEYVCVGDIYSLQFDYVNEQRYG